MCIGWIIKCLIVVDARCKHEDRRRPLIVASICTTSSSVSTLGLNYEGDNTFLRDKQRTVGKPDPGVVRTIVGQL